MRFSGKGRIPTSNVENLIFWVRNMNVMILDGKLTKDSNGSISKDRGRPIVQASVTVKLHGCILRKEHNTF